MTITIHPMWILFAILVGWIVIGLFIGWLFVKKDMFDELGGYITVFWPICLVIIAFVGIIKEFVHMYQVVHSPRKKCI